MNREPPLVARFSFILRHARHRTVAKFVKYYDVKGPGRGQSLIHLFTFSLIVARDRAPDLLEQGRRHSDSTQTVLDETRRDEGPPSETKCERDDVLEVKRAGKRKWISS